MMNAVMDAIAAPQAMSKQALNSESIRARMLAVLLGPGELWEALRGVGSAGSHSIQGAPARPCRAACAGVPERTA